MIGWFLLAPLGVTLVAYLCLTLSIFYNFVRVSKTQVISESARASIKSTLVKIVATFVVPISLLILSTIVHHLYLFMGADEWDLSL